MNRNAGDFFTSESLDLLDGLSESESSPVSLPLELRDGEAPGWSGVEWRASLLDEKADLILIKMRRSGEDAEEFARQLESFSAVVTESITEENRYHLYGHFAGAVTSLTDFSTVLIAVYADEPPHTRLIATSGFTDEQIQSLSDALVPQAAMRQILLNRDFSIGATGRLLRLSDAGMEALEKSLDGATRVLLLPLSAGERLIGYLALFVRRDQSEPTARSVKPVELFAVQMSQVLARNLLEEQLRERQRDLELLYDIAMLINSSLDAEEVLRKLTDYLQKQLEYVHVSVYTLEEDVLRLAAGAGADAGRRPAELAMGEGAIGSAAYRGETVLIRDAADAEDSTAMAPGIGSQVSVPIAATTTLEGEETQSVIGVLNVESNEPNCFSAEDIRRLEAVANTTSMAIENSRLMQRVLSLLQDEAAHALELSHKKKELDEFVHTISHDLKNPLNNIAGFADLLQSVMGGEGGDTARYLQRIQANVQVVTRMIDDLLELSRVGRVDDAMRPIPLQELVREIKFDSNAAFSDEQLELNFFNLPETVNGNRSRLAQLFNNLITNAVKYRHPQRPPRVTISCVDEGDYYQFAVSDNGIGMDPSLLPSIFVFGVRLKEKDVEGTGAGLAIAKKIIESHQGRIWVESEKGEGATFYFTLPKYVEEQG